MAGLGVKTGDQVTVLAGKLKGQTAKVVKTQPDKNKVFLENLGMRKRHMKPTQLNPSGGSKDIHQGVDASNVKLETPAPKGKTNTKTRASTKTKSKAQAKGGSKS